MSNQLIIHLEVNVNGKNEAFLYTFNPFFHTMQPANAGRVSFLDQIRHRHTLQYKNRNYIALDNNKYNTTDKVKDYVTKIMNDRYGNKYLLVPQLNQRYKVNSFILTKVTKTTGDKILFNKGKSTEKLLVDKLGQAYFENLKPTQNVYIAFVKFFVEHKKRALGDKFDEFCIRNKAELSRSWNTFAYHYGLKTGGGVVRSGKQTRKAGRQTREKRRTYRNRRR